MNLMQGLFYDDPIRFWDAFYADIAVYSDATLMIGGIFGALDLELETVADRDVS
jgi:hypothetical protein